MPFKFNPFSGNFDEVKDISGKTDKVNPSVDNAVVKSDGTTGAQQNSGVIIDDSNNITGVNDLTVGGDLTVNGTTTTINTANLDVTDANITVNNNGNDASSEGAGLTVERTSTNGSIVYEDSLTSKFKLGALGSEVEITDVSSSQTLTNKTIDADSNSISNIDNNEIKAGANIDLSKLEALTVSRALVSDVSGVVSASNITSVELDYLDGVTSNLQTQLNAKEPTITVLPVAKGGTNSSTALTNDLVMISSAGSIVESTISTTELGYLDNVTSDIQAQLNDKIEYDVQTNSGAFGAVAGQTFLVNTSASAATVNLPAAVLNAFVILKDASGNAKINNITVNGQVGENIDGTASIVMDSNYESKTFVSDGSNWFII